MTDCPGPAQGTWPLVRRQQCAGLLGRERLTRGVSAGMAQTRTPEPHCLKASPGGAVGGDRQTGFCGSWWDSFRSCPHLSCGLISLTFTPRQSARFSSHGFGKGLSSFSGVPSQRRGGGLSVSTHLGVLPSYRRGLEEFGSQPSSQLRAMPRETANSARI